MSVLIDFSPLDTPSRLRGIGRYISGLAQGFIELRSLGELELDVDGLAQFDWLGHSAGPCGLDYTGTPVHPNGYRWFPYRARKRLGLERAATRLGAELLHVTEPVAMPRPRKTPIVVTCHDLIPLVLHREYLGASPLKRAWRKRQDTERYAMARRIVAVSEATRRDLVEQLGIDPAKIDVTHLGIESERFQPVSAGPHERDVLCKKYGLARPFLLYVGAFDVRKSIPLLVQAFADAGLARDFDLVLGGAMEDAYRIPLSSLAKSLGLEQVTRFIGYVDETDLAPLYRACHLHAFPSTYEGFGLPVAEALACGAPTITTNVSSLPEVAGDAALLVPPGERDALSHALRSLAFDDAKRAELRGAGVQRASGFRWRDCARKTLASYKRALATL